jgi:hypothetical protein
MPEAVPDTRSAHSGSGSSKCQETGRHGEENVRGRTQKRLQLVDCNSLTSDGFVRPPSIEPSPRTNPGFQHLEERPAALWKKHKESRKGKLSRKETALPDDPSLDRGVIDPASPGRFRSIRDGRRIFGHENKQAGE